MKESTQILAGRRPILEVLTSEGEILEILFSAASFKSLKDLLDLAEKRGIPTRQVDLAEISRLYDGNHQGVIARIKEFKYFELEEVLRGKQNGNRGSFIVILDHIQDPFNLGAIIRSACVCGADGVVIPKDRGARITTTVLKAASGACEHMPIVMVNNLTRTIKELQKKNFWVYAADPCGDEVFAVEFEKNVAVVIGAEHSGVSRLVKESSDFLIGIPMFGVPLSFNASVAAGIILMDVARKRRRA